MGKVEEVADVAVEKSEDRTVTITVVDNKLSVSSDASLVETLFILNEGSRFVLERAAVNSQVAQEVEED